MFSHQQGRSYTDGFFYEQRIKLPRKVQHGFASPQSGDDLFTGKKFVEYPDGSVFLHVELVAEVKDNYIPEERMLDPKYMKSVPKTETEAMETEEMETEPTTNSSTRVLTDEKNETTVPKPSKRTRVDDSVVVETVSEDSDGNGDDNANADGEEEEEEDDLSQLTGPNANAAAGAAAAKAEAIAFAEAARNKAATVLGQAEHGSSSLQQAAAKGAGLEAE